MTAAKAIAKGLEGVIIDDSSICMIDGNAGRLIYRGYDIHDLAANLAFEEVAYLLWNGNLPTKTQLADLNKRLIMERSIPADLKATIRNLPRTSNTLDVLRTAISTLGTGIPLKKPDISDAIAITAKMPTINAAFDRLRRGQEPLDPLPGLGHAANYIYMLTGKEPEEAKVDALDKYLILLADHGMNSSTFTARIVASTWSDMYSAITAAIGALKGPLHGGAPAPVLQMLKDIGNPERAEPWIRDELKAGRRLMGFGHRVYRTTDPRAEILRDIANKTADKRFFELARSVEETAIRILQTEKSRKKLYTNVEFYSAVVMDSVGLPPDLFTATFAASRSVGWSANVLEQVANNRLIRPETEYTGPRDRKVVPIDKR
ncbi:MAG: citrate synthase [Candidatus Bathyarchaeia archaeon]